MTEETWQERATCARTDPTFWFPEKGESVGPAKNICNTRCPVRNECLWAAINNSERHGIWGGMTTLERDRHIWPHGTAHHYGTHKCRCRPCVMAESRKKNLATQRKARWRDKLEEEAG